MNEELQDYIFHDIHISQPKCIKNHNTAINVDIDEYKSFQGNINFKDP
jgi:hypothetical protein